MNDVLAFRNVRGCYSRREFPSAELALHIIRVLQRLIDDRMTLCLHYQTGYLLFDRSDAIDEILMLDLPLWFCFGCLTRLECCAWLLTISLLHRGTINFTHRATRQVFIDLLYNRYTLLSLELNTGRYF